MGRAVKWWLLLTICCVNQVAHAQEEEPNAIQLEQQEQTLPENDEEIQQREVFAGRKLNLNTADEAALASLGLLHALQIENFLLYRKTLGPLISIYELQAVPGFDIPLIRTLLPFVQAGNGLDPYYTWRDYMKRGKHTLLLRYRHPFQKEEGYRGSEDKILLRYRYQFSRYASWGLIMEKDAGEEFFKGKQKKGFDHYGMHLFLRNIGRIKALAIGDYTVNMGQGLIQWHGLAFGKSGAVMHTKREGDVLRPYASAGEFFFYRGAGITYQTGRFTFTAFMSARKLDARIGEMVDSAGSLVSTGYHRTDAELALKGNITQSTAGGVFRWSIKRGHIAWNIIGHKFSTPLSKGDKAYQLYTPGGNYWENSSIDHAFNWRNLHFFGEAAISKQRKLAVLQGAMITLAHGVDLGILYRNETPAYQTLYGNAFGESSTIGNESGLYTALLLKWGAKWELTTYADVFRFPWLKYRIDAPSEGYDVLASMTWRPDKTTQFNAQFRYEDKPLMQKQQLRTQWNMQIAEGITWKSKVQVMRSRDVESFLAHQQCQIKRKHYKITAAYTWFNTANTEGLYLSGQGFPNDHSLTRFSGKGSSLQFAIQFNLSKSSKIWCRWEKITDKTSPKKHIALQLQWQLSTF